MPDPLPYSGWRRRIGLTLLLAAVGGVILIASGSFDPRPIGQERWHLAPGVWSIPTNTRSMCWLASSLPPDHFSLRLRAARQEGEPDISYGLIIGDEHRYLAVTVSPLGYVAVWESERIKDEQPITQTQPQTFHVPLATFPHVRSGSMANEIWLDVNHNHISVRINRERLWQGEANALKQQVGLIAESFGEAAVVNFELIQLYTNIPVPSPVLAESCLSCPNVSASISCFIP